MVRVDLLFVFTLIFDLFTRLRQKKALRKQCFFQLNPPLAEEIHLRWMKSLRDEIPLRGKKRGGFNFIWGFSRRFHPSKELQSNSRGFHRAQHDFIDSLAIAYWLRWSRIHSFFHACDGWRSLLAACGEGDVWLISPCGGRKPSQAAERATE